MVKPRFLAALLPAALCAALVPARAAPAAAESDAYTPQNVAAELMEVTAEHPKGSARITFTVADLPRSTDTERWQIVVDRKIGGGGWAEVLRMDTSVCMDRHSAGGDAYMLEQVWSESADWDGKSSLSYRVYVILYDAAGNIVAQSAYSRVATVGLVTSPWAEQEVLRALTTAWFRRRSGPRISPRPSPARNSASWPFCCMKKRRAPGRSPRRRILSATRQIPRY